MTTNKPVVVGYIDELEFIQRIGRVPFLHPTPNRRYTTPLILLSDYEAIQAECDQLRKDSERMTLALKRIAGMDSMSYHSLDSAKITARAAMEPIK